MHWGAGPTAGFTTGEPWLPIGADAAQRNVDAQRADRGSLLWLYKDLLALRRATPALEGGRFRGLEAKQGVLAYERHQGASRALVALNFTDVACSPGLPSARVIGGLRTRAGAALPADSATLELGPSEAAVLVVDG